MAEKPVARFENGLELDSAAIQNDRLSPGEPARFSFVWRVTRPISLTYELTVEAFDMHGKSVGRLDSLPLGGHKPTRIWQVGDVYRDDYSMALHTGNNDSPLIANLYVGWHDTAPPYRIATLQASGAASAPFGRVKVRAAGMPDTKPQQAFSAQFGDVIGLEGYDLNNDQLTLYWRALRRVPIDYQVFVHVFDAQHNIIAQADGPMPYPSSLWDQHEQVLDRRPVPGLAHADAVDVGVYDLASGARLEARRADGGTWPDNSVELWRRVTP
jgi:hypothetical protein